MKINVYIKPNIESVHVPELMQTILPGGSTPPGEGDAKKHDLIDSDTDNDDDQTSNMNIWEN